jgi:hypothetical protein
MKTRLKNYVFTPGAAGVGTLQLTDYAAISKEAILMVFNQTTGVWLYNFADSTMLGTVSGNTLTFAQASNGLSALSTDKLLIYYEDGIPTSDLMLIGAAAQTVLGNNALLATAGAGSQDCLGFRSATVQVVSTGTAGTHIFEGSNDGTNWVTIPVYNMTVFTGTPINAAITATASTIVYSLPILTRFIRHRIATAITGGSIQDITRLSTAPFAPAITQVGNATAANLQATVSGTVTVTQGTAGAAAWLANPLHPVQANTADTGAKIATPFNGATQTNAGSKGGLIVFNIGAITLGTGGTATFKLQGSADGGTTWVDIPGATTAAITLTGAYGIMCYPGATPVAAVATVGTTAVVNVPLPRIWRVVGTFAGSGYSFTITNVQVSLIV